jgi:hypothetical protein
MAEGVLEAGRRVEAVGAAVALEEGGIFFGPGDLHYQKTISASRRRTVVVLGAEGIGLNLPSTAHSELHHRLSTQYPPATPPPSESFHSRAHSHHCVGHAADCAAH